MHPWPSVSAIEERPGPLRRADVRAGRPIVCRGAARWPALSRWSRDALCARVGTRLVTTYRIADGELRFDDRRGVIDERMPLASVLDRDHELRVRAVMHEELPELLSDIEIPEACGRLRLEANFWLSGPDVRSRLHFDQPENALAQIQGTKQAWLFAPRDRRWLYPYPLTSATAQFSRVDLRAPDVERFPDLSRARPLRSELRPGDLLYIPGGWWHYLASDEPTISVGLRFWRKRRLPLLLAADAYKRIRGHVR